MRENSLFVFVLDNILQKPIKILSVSKILCVKYNDIYLNKKIIRLSHLKLVILITYLSNNLNLE